MPIKYVLDSNIVVDLEKFYYEPKRLSQQDKENLVDLLSEVKLARVDYSYALTELSSDILNGVSSKNEISI